MASRAFHASWEHCVGESQRILTAIKIERAFERIMASTPNFHCQGTKNKEEGYLRGVMTEKAFLYKTFLRLKITHKKERRRNVRYREFPNPRSLREDDSEPRGVAACHISSEES